MSTSFQPEKNDPNPAAAANGARHAGPHPGIVAIVYTLLFSAGLYLAIGAKGGVHFPGPWESVETISAYFQSRATAVRWCAFLQFGAAIPLGIFTATMVSRLRFLGVRAAGAYIALFGGFMAAFGMAVSANILWVIAHPGVAQDTAVLRALYYLGFSFAGAGFSVPMGLLIAGLCVPAAFMRLLPKWLVVFGLAVAIIGELSALNLIIPQALFLIPLTRFPAFIWLIAAGFALPNAKKQTTNQRTAMKPFVFIFRQDNRRLSDEEQKRRAEEVRAWALGQVAGGRKLDPHLMGPEYCRISGEGESHQIPAGTDSPPVAIVFFEAADFDEATRIAKTHPGIRYGVSIEVRPWTSPVPSPDAN